MDAVGGTASSFHLIYQFFSRLQQARAFEEEFGFYQLQLKVHLSRCATVSRIIYDTNGADNILAIYAIGGPKRSLDHLEPVITDILSAIQDKLHKAQQEAAKIEADLQTFGPPQLESVDGPKTMGFRMTRYLNQRKAQAAKTVEGIKWAFYKRDQHDKFIADISALIKHLERRVNANKESLSFRDARLIYITRAHSSAM
ncbi:hypothetical protein GGI35DRAFT_474410 [Trichoderma velutinum]